MTPHFLARKVRQTLTYNSPTTCSLSVSDLYWLTKHNNHSLKRLPVSVYIICNAPAHGDDWKRINASPALEHFLHQEPKRAIST